MLYWNSTSFGLSSDACPMALRTQLTTNYGVVQ